MRDRLALTIEDFIVAAITWIAAIPQRLFLAFAEVGKLLVRSFDVAPSGQAAFEADLAALAAPHMAVLVHKRTKMYVATDEGAVERWSLELRCFMERNLLPFLGGDREYAERNRMYVSEILDHLVESEQARAAEHGAHILLPHVTPFESSWAI